MGPRGAYGRARGGVCCCKSRAWGQCRAEGSRMALWGSEDVPAFTGQPFQSLQDHRITESSRLEETYKIT